AVHRGPGRRDQGKNAPTVRIVPDSCELLSGDRSEGGTAGLVAVADVADGDDAGCVRAELHPQPADVHVDRAAAHVRAVPDRADQLAPAEHAARVLGEEGEQLEL